MPISKPRFDTRRGVTAGITARIWIAAMVCAFQYWLITASMEAVHGGNLAIALPAFLVSVVCLLLVAGLVITGEAGAQKMEHDLKWDDE